MFVKFGNEKNLKDLMVKGEIYFSPCKVFREFEEKYANKGIGDCNDSSIVTKNVKAFLDDKKGKQFFYNSVNVSSLIKPCENTPVFCLKKTNCEYITIEERNILNEQFPEHTHALIIEDEDEFLENIRFNFKSKAFSHEIFYQDEFFVDFEDFLYAGSSKTHFYKPKAKQEYYASYNSCDNEGNLIRKFKIDNSNFYRTMFRKSIFFENQKEFRIVLPYEKIEKGKVYSITPFKAKLVTIDDLVN